MSLTRRGLLLGSLAAFLAGCQRGNSPSAASILDEGSNSEPRILPRSIRDRSEMARKRAAKFLESKQSSDGAWRSDIFGTFKDGTALTPLVLHALLLTDSKCPSVPRAARYLVDMVQADGTVRAPEKHGFDYPLYTSALSVTALSNSSLAEYRHARNAWLSDLRTRQLTEQHGWQPADREYGGWGYCHSLPRRPRSGELIPPMTESNISATAFALTALTAAAVPATDPAFTRALTFVKRCQNWPDDDAKRNLTFDDGGFFFIYDDPIRNKAASAGKDANGVERYRSYGSVTADGFRCLTLCGLEADSSRFRAAAHWLQNHFLPDHCPGPFPAKAEVARASLYFYWTMSMAQTELRTWQPQDVKLRGGPKSPKTWHESLADAVIAKQRSDGSWSNPADAFRENDPLVATSFACIALAYCVRHLES